MGVPSFYRWLSKKYPKIVVDCVEESGEVINGVKVPIDTSLPNPNGIEFDNLYLDMNGIIHPASHPEDRPPPLTEDDMYLAIFAYLERVFACVRPRKLLFMAIDGVAPRAKMNQQRSRRFRAAQEAAQRKEAEERIRNDWAAEGRELPPKKPKAFDSNVITPGTPFMDRLAVFLKFFVHRKLETDPGWKNIKVILSDAFSPGEGEHKIMEYIRLQRTMPEHDADTRHCIHGLDADLIMLSLATHEPHFTILREMVTFEQPKDMCSMCGQNGHTADDCKGEARTEDEPSLPPPTPFQFLHINVLREYLEKEFGASNYECVGGFNLERVIDDFVFMCFFVGNDFLPHLPSLEIREGAIETLMDLYKKVFQELGGYLTKGPDIDLKRVARMLHYIGNVEDSVLSMRRQKEEKFKRKDKQRDSDLANRAVEKKHLVLIQRLGLDDGEPPLKKKKEANGDSDNEDAFRIPQGLTLRDVKDRASPRDVQDLRLYDRIRTFYHTLDEDAPKVLMLKGLTGYQRAMAHQYCDILELEHPSVGQDPNRFIKVTKVGAGGRDPTEVLDGQIKSKLREGNIVEQEDPVQLGLPGWKERYYSNKFGPGIDRDKIFYSYLEGLSWVMRYYYEGCQSWGWFYPFHYAPFASDLYTFLETSFNGLEDFEMGKPFKPFEQLMAVFPAASSHALPRAFGDLMSDPESGIIDFYPTDFALDMNGKKFAWQAVVLLPFIEEGRLLSALTPHEHTLTEDEARRNSHGPQIIMCSKDNELAKSILKLQKETECIPGEEKAGKQLPFTADGMHGRIKLDPAAVPFGEDYAPPKFQGYDDPLEFGLTTFNNRTLSCIFVNPDVKPHLSVILDRCHMPKRVLDQFDQVQVQMFTPATGGNIMGGHAMDYRHMKEFRVDLRHRPEHHMPSLNKGMNVQAANRFIRQGLGLQGPPTPDTPRSFASLPGMGGPYPNSPYGNGGDGYGSGYGSPQSGYGSPYPYSQHPQMRPPQFPPQPQHGFPQSPGGGGYPASPGRGHYTPGGGRYVQSPRGFPQTPPFHQQQYRR